jgi:hypothetical protein
VAGRSKSEAKDRFCGFFKESLSCLTDAFLQPVQISDNRFLLTYEPRPDLRCEIGPARFRLSISQLFRLAQDGAHGGYKVKTLEYDYSLLGPDETATK